MAAPQLHPSLGPLVEELAKLPHVRRVLLFGSRARGTARERSDIDLAVEAPGADYREWLEAEDAVENARTLLKIDLVRFENAPPELRNEILKDGVVLLAK